MVLLRLVALEKASDDFKNTTGGHFVNNETIFPLNLASGQEVSHNAGQFLIKKCLAYSYNNKPHLTRYVKD